MPTIGYERLLSFDINFVAPINFENVPSNMLNFESCF